MPTYVDLKCIQCEKPFKRELRQCYRNDKYGSNPFCSSECSYKYTEKSSIINCTQCNKELKKSRSQIKKSKSGNMFCNRSCSATYNNLHKKTGTRRSKLEKWIEEQLTILYPNLEIHFNQKDTINSELDIFIPSLKLAFELNGIYHYEPIHGQKKFNQIQNNDHRKFSACIERNIELCIIDTSNQNYFKIKSSQKFLDIITSILNDKIGSQSRSQTCTA